MNPPRRGSLSADLLLPTLYFVALGAMTWAVRGCSGFGAMDGCVFAGVTWGAGWWYLSRQPAGSPPRPYNSGWVILALTLGIGVSGDRGWMQWPSFFAGHLQTNSPEGKWVPISREYGFIWMFIAGVPWGGLGACALAWCGTHRRLCPRGWLLRIACGVAGAAVGRVLFDHFPDVFLPLHSSLADRYADAAHNPNLRRLFNDNQAAMTHLGVYLGCLAFEAGRRNWRGARLILTVGLVSGAGWAAFQNWTWAAHFWPDARFNFWRCWESSGGISIGLAYGLAFYIANRPGAESEPTPAPAPACGDFRWEKFGAYAGLIFGLGLSTKNGFKGWANIYLGHEEHWNDVGWAVMGPLMLIGIAWAALRRPTRGGGSDPFPNAAGLIWLVLIVQNIIAQFITGPLSSWNEVAFSIYYVLLFCITAVITHHQTEKTRGVANA